MKTKKELFLVRRNDNTEIGEVFGERLSEFFAWTPGKPESKPAGKCSVLTHIPTGRAIWHTLKNKEVARAIIVALHQLEPKINWGEANAGALGEAIAQATREHGGAIAWMEKTLDRITANLKPKAPATALEKLLATKEWRGSTYVEESREAPCKSGDCVTAYSADKALRCTKEHYVTTITVKGRDRKVSRHYAPTPGYKITHPNGRATAWLRADAEL